MKLKILMFTTISTILLMMKDISSVASKQIRMPDMRLIKNSYAKDTLKKLLRLYDYYVDKHIFQLSQARNEIRGPGVAEDEFLEVFNKKARNGNQFCFCRNKNSDLDFDSSEEFRSITVNREKAVPDLKLLLTNGEPNQVILLSIYNNRQCTDITSNEPELSSNENEDLRSLTKKSKSGKYASHKSKLGKTLLSERGTCISQDDAYHDCKGACRDAAYLACSDRENICSDRLQHRLRKECKTFCRKRFIERYEN